MRTEVVLVVPVVPVVLAPVLVAVLGLVVLVLVAGFRTAEVAPVVPDVDLTAGLAGVDARVLVLREEAVDTVDFFSSSLALILGRLRWLELEVAVVGRRVAVVEVVGGRVGGLVRPPVAREVAVVPAVRDAVVEVAPGRRRVLVLLVVPGLLAAAVVLVVEGLASMLDLAAGASGAASGLGSGTGSGADSVAAAASGEDGVGSSSFS